MVFVKTLSATISPTGKTAALSSMFVLGIAMFFCHGKAIASTVKPVHMRVTALDIHIQFDDDKTVIRRIERRRIESAAGRAYEMHVAYDTPRYRLKDASLRIVDSTGGILSEYDRRQMIRLCGYDESSTLYSDDCRVMADPGVSRFPLLMEFETVHELPGNFLLSEIFTQPAWPVDRLNITLEVRTDIHVRWKWYGAQPPTPSSGSGVMKWEIDSIPSWEPHEYTASSVRPLQLQLQSDKIQFGKKRHSLATWNAVASMYRYLSADRYLEPVTQPSNICTKSTLDAIYIEQIRKIRYVSVNRKMSGWQTEPAATVERVGYGDCKGSTTLLVSRFRSAGAQAFPALVLTRGEGIVDPEFVTDNFNHVITMAVVQTDTLWYDPTCTLCPPGELPEADEGMLALIVGDSNGTLMTLPRSKANENRSVTSSHLVIDGAGQCRIDTYAQYDGNIALSRRYSIQGETQRERTDSFLEFLAMRRSEFLLDSLEYLDELDITLPLKRHVYLSRLRPLAVKGAAFFNPFIYSRANDYDHLLTAPDSLSVDLGNPKVLHDSCILSGEYIRQADSILLPPSDSVSFPGGLHSIHWERKNDTVVGHLRSELHTSLLEATAVQPVKEAYQFRKRMLSIPIRFYFSDH
jgi:hypothetical protein